MGYREIKKVIQNHALSLSQKNNKKTSIDNKIKSRSSFENVEVMNESKINDHDETDDDEHKSYRKNTKKIKQKTDKKNIKTLLQKSGISAISSIDFRMKHCELFWNLSWHFSNLRLPIHFLENAFYDKNEINTKQIDDLIHFVPLIQENGKKNKYKKLQKLITKK